MCSNNLPIVSLIQWRLGSRLSSRALHLLTAPDPETGPAATSLAVLAEDDADLLPDFIHDFCQQEGVGQRHPWALLKPCDGGRVLMSDKAGLEEMHTS